MYRFTRISKNYLLLGQQTAFESIDKCLATSKSNNFLDLSRICRRSHPPNYNLLQYSTGIRVNDNNPLPTKPVSTPPKKLRLVVLQNNMQKSRRFVEHNPKLLKSHLPFQHVLRSWYSTSTDKTREFRNRLGSTEQEPWEKQPTKASSNSASSPKAYGFMLDAVKYAQETTRRVSETVSKNSDYFTNLQERVKEMIQKVPKVNFLDKFKGTSK